MEAGALPDGAALLRHWEREYERLRRLLRELEAANARRAQADAVRAECARYEQLIAGALGTGPEHALCVACGTATASPHALLFAERGDEADIELMPGAPDLDEWPVLRRKPTAHLAFNRFVLCATCADVWRVDQQAG